MPAARALNCRVITPEAKVFDGTAELVVVPAHDGEIGILLNRAPLVAKLGAGRLRLNTPDGGRESWFIDGGFVQVLDNRVVVLTQKAVRPEQIDRGRALEQLAAARAMPAGDDMARTRKAAAEASARARLRVARGVESLPLPDGRGSVHFTVASVTHAYAMSAESWCRISVIFTPLLQASAQMPQLLHTFAGS